MFLSDLIEESHACALEKGWWDDYLPRWNHGSSDKPDMRPDRTMSPILTPDAIASKLALTHGELSEALECLRTGDIVTGTVDGKPEGFFTELADVYIRLADLAEAMGYKGALEDAIAIKLKYNRTRPYRHGGKHL